MRFSLGMRTVDRSPVARNYAAETLANLERAGAYRSRHFAGFSIACSTDSVAHLGEHPWRVIVPGEGWKMTPNETALHAIAAAAQVAEADWIFHLEDDLDFCARFLESVACWIVDEVKPSDRLLTFATLKTAVAKLGDRRSFLYPMPKFHGSQCYAVRAADASSLVAYLTDHPTYEGTHQCHDLLLHGWLAEVGGDIRATVPSFVDHVGLESKLSPGSRHVVTGFPGHTWKYHRRRPAA